MIHSKNLSALLGVELYLKLEPMQKTGSFKVRGALNRILQLTEEEKKRGIVSLSAGNHAQAAAWAATSAGVKSTIVMPATAVKGKVEATKNYGGEVVQTDGSLIDMVHKLQAERGLVLVHPFDDPFIIAGAGTATDEVFDDLEDPDAIVFGVGGGGFGAGVAVVSRARRPATRLIAVGPEGVCAMRESYDKGEPVTLAQKPVSVADGLAAPFAGKLNYAHFKAHDVDVYTIPDAKIVAAMWLLMERCKIVAEPAAAAGLAALINALPKPAIAPKSKVVLMVTGGNVDRERLKQLA
jgi:threonine dehydratase